MAEARVSCSSALMRDDKMESLDMSFSKLSTVGKDKITIKKYIIYVVLIVIAFILIFDGLFMYLIADIKQCECACVLPVGYENTPSTVTSSQVGTRIDTGKTTRSSSAPPTATPGLFRCVNFFV